MIDEFIGYDAIALGELILSSTPLSTKCMTQPVRQQKHGVQS